MKKTVTFKKEPQSTGLARIGEGHVVTMKIKKQKFGTIRSPSWNDKFHGWQITFAVKDDESGWKWKRIKDTFVTEELARDFAKNYFPSRASDLYLFDN